MHSESAVAEAAGAIEPVRERATGGLRLFLVLGMVTVVSPVAMDLYLPGLPSVAASMGVTASAAQLTLTTFMLGIGIGQLTMGSVSDAFGRRRPLLAGLSLFVLVSLACALAPNLYVLAGLRLLQGAAGASGMVIGRAIVRDLYGGAEAARYLSRLMLIIGLAPVLAPVVGGQILRVTSWRGLFLAVAAIAVVLVAASFRFLPETLPPERRRPAGIGATLSTYAHLVVDRSFVGFALIIGFGAGAVFGWLSGSSFLLQEVYGVSPQLYGVLFGAGALVMVAGAQLNAHLLGRVPTRRLLGAGVTMVAVAGALFLVAVPLRGAGLALVMLPIALVFLSWSFVQANTVALALTSRPAVAGSAAGMLGVTQFAFGALAAPLVGVAGGDAVLPLALVVAVCGVAAVLSFALLVAPRPARA